MSNMSQESKAPILQAYTALRDLHCSVFNCCSTDFPTVPEDYEVYMVPQVPGCNGWAQKTTYMSHNPRFLTFSAWDHLERWCQHDDWMGHCLIADALWRESTSRTVWKQDLELCQIEVWRCQAGRQRIAQGAEEIQILVIWTLLHDQNRCTNIGLAPESTAERFTECSDDRMAGVYLAFRFPC